MAVNLKAPDPKQLHPVPGVTLGVAMAGVRKANRRDVTVVRLDEGALVAGVFTRNRFCAAPVQLCRQHLGTPLAPRAVLINTGNANAGTGEDGLARAFSTCVALARHLSIAPEQVLPFSTGVIMEPLPVDKIAAGLPAAVANMRADKWFDAAHAIMTTDIVAKAISKQVIVDGVQVTISGIAKGSGMIHPNMATMLCFIVTDAAIAAPLLRRALVSSTERSFNSITVDGDTSTNDTILCMANGAAGNKRIAAGSKDFRKFQSSLDAVMRSLARQVVRDGEGATKFVEVEVRNARNPREAKQAAMTVAKSSLVKTALFGEDANWGRIMAAVGYSGVDIDEARTDIYIGKAKIVEKGLSAGKAAERDAAPALKQREVQIVIDLHKGKGSATVWTCDLSYEYVKINAAYRS